MDMAVKAKNIADILFFLILAIMELWRNLGGIPISQSLDTPQRNPMDIPYIDLSTPLRTYQSFLHFSCFFSVCAGNGTLVTFDDLPNNFVPIPNCYNNINWGNGYYLNRYSVGNTSGYYTATVSGNNSLYNWGGLPMSMTSATGRLFILNSVIVAAAWDDNLSLTVTGYHSSAIIQNQTFTLQVFTASYLNFSGYSGLDTVIFTTFGGTLDPNVSGNGTQFGMDNVCLTFI